MGGKGGVATYKDTASREPDKLSSLEGIEIAVREQMQNSVSKDIGIFLGSISESGR